MEGHTSRVPKLKLCVPFRNWINFAIQHVLLIPLQEQTLNIHFRNVLANKKIGTDYDSIKGYCELHHKNEIKNKNDVKEEKKLIDIFYIAASVSAMLSLRIKPTNPQWNQNY